MIGELIEALVINVNETAAAAVCLRRDYWTVPSACAWRTVSGRFCGGKFGERQPGKELRTALASG